MRRRFAAWLHRCAAWLEASGHDEVAEPSEWIKHDGSEPKQAAIAAHVAPAGRELGITSPPAADVWRYYEVPDVDMQPTLSRTRNNPQGYL